MPISAFTDRHIGPRTADIPHMLEVVGQPDLATMVGKAIPDSVRAWEGLDLPEAVSEAEALQLLADRAEKNEVITSMIGMGYYGTHTPTVIKRNILENPAWYTSYTPYQPEISQGRLEAMLNFQTMVSDLTGLPIAGSSLLDESTAAAEAMTLMARATRAKAESAVIVDSRLFPQTLAVIKTRADLQQIPVITADLSAVRTVAELQAIAGGPFFGVIVQYPAKDGEISDYSKLAAAAHGCKALITAAADLLALTMITPPGEWGADIAVGNTQRFGVPMGFGGPHAGYMAVIKKLLRQMPGRLVGVSVDSAGNPAFRLTLQTREQHIRRERATSNICTAQALLAVLASMYAVYHGPDGLLAIAADVHSKAARLASSLRTGGYEIDHEHFFDTVAVRGDATELTASALSAGINVYPEDGRVLVSVDETTTEAQLQALCAAWSCQLQQQYERAIPDHLRRESEYLTHPVFNTHHSETMMLRYMRTLANRDFALDTGMIPLGSCTMKLNATTEMEAITWPTIGALHPYAPANQVQGMHEIIAEMETWLAEITGYDAVSLQPNSGAAGEFAGLMAIVGYHRSRGEENRNICLIPASAHGTNAASAVMAGLRVVVVKTSFTGEVDMDDLKHKLVEHGDNLAAIMITYPSTHGVYEDTVHDLCDLVHQAGGQVYIDGANMNALVGLGKPGHFGGDVSHLNLHKTFAIPHGGGGPGVGPIGVGKHLAPFLPSTKLGKDGVMGPVAGAPYGSASVLPITWAYIRMMGGAGLQQATTMAMLGANYIAFRLREAYPVLYSGVDGLVAHECILDLRGITKETGVTVDDVAKRLIDYGFHAPTMSFPVAGTLMVEPTESESLAELDRFCAAMLAIRAEIDAVGSGEIALEESMLRNAPHTAASMAGEWPYSYDRADAVYPGGMDPQSKYWAPVRRIDGAFGDRNPVCSCPLPEAYED